VSVRNRPLSLAAFGRALARVLFAARSHATLQAHALTTATGGQRESGERCGTGSSFAISFGNDFVAHVNFHEIKEKGRI